MAIIFNEQQKTFKLDASNSTYIIKIYEEGYLLNLYYGRKIPESSIEGFEIRARNAAFSPYDPALGDGRARIRLSPRDLQNEGRRCALGFFRVRNGY